MTRRTVQDVKTEFIYLTIQDFKKGETIVGVYKGSFQDKKYGNDRHMLQERENEILVFPNWVSIDKGFKDSKAKKGDKVEVIFKGSVPTKNGYNQYVFEIAASESSEKPAASSSKTEESPF